MFDGALNVKLAGRLLKLHYQKLIVMRGIEHKMSLFFNDVSKITIVNKIIFAQNMIYNVFGCSIYHTPRSILKSKSQEFHNKNFDLFSGNETSMSGYFMGMHRDLRMWRVIQATTLYP